MNRTERILTPDGVKIYYIGVTQEEGQSFNISPKVLEYGYIGGSQSLVITNPMNNEWKFVGQPGWITLSSISGSDATTVTATATENTTDDERKGSVVFWNMTTDTTYVVSCFQKKAPTAITFDNVIWVNDVPSSGGTATKNNCSYTVIGQYADGTTDDLTDFATVTGSLFVPFSGEGERHSAGTLTLTASYGSFTASTDVTVYQEAGGHYLRLNPSTITFNATGGTATINVESNIDWNVKISWETVVTGITIDNFEWTSNFPSSAGTYLTKDYSTFNVTAHYDNGATKDVTNEAEITGQVTLEENTTSESRIVQAPLNAKYVVLTISVTKKGFQSGAASPTTLYIKNESQYQISGDIVGLGTPDTISIQAGETIGRTDTLPITITQADLVGNGLSSGKIVLSNGQETIDCLWDASNNAFTGNGSITLTNNNNTLTINYLQ